MGEEEIKIDTPMTEQSPEVFDDQSPEVDAISENVTDTTGDTLFNKRIILGKYSVSASSEVFIENCKTEIDKILEIIQSKDDFSLRNYMLESSRNIDSTHIIELFESDKLTDDDKTMLAIGIWVSTKMPRWKGDFAAGKKLTFGGKYSLDTFLDPEDKQTCLDVNLLIHQLTKSYGIEGQIYRLGRSLFAHRFWESESGKIVDPMHGWRVGGYFNNEDSYRKYLKDNPSKSYFSKWEHRNKKVPEKF